MEPSLFRRRAPPAGGPPLALCNFPPPGGPNFKTSLHLSRFARSTAESARAHRGAAAANSEEDHFKGYGPISRAALLNCSGQQEQRQDSSTKESARTTTGPAPLKIAPRRPAPENQQEQRQDSSAQNQQRRAAARTAPPGTAPPRTSNEERPPGQLRPEPARSWASDKDPRRLRLT